MKKVIVTGAGGFIGKSLCKYLLEKDYKVVGIDISKANLISFEKYENFSYVIAKDEFTLQDKGVLYDADIAYLIGWGGSLLSKDLEDINLQLNNVGMIQRYVSNLVTLNCKKLIFCGSSYQYMIYNNSEVSANAYSIAKETACKIVEYFCYKNNVDFNIALLTNTYGKGDYSKKAVNTFIRKMINNEELHLIEGQYKNDWVYIDDTIEGLFQVGINGVNAKRYYIGHKNILTFRETLTEMKRILNYPKELLFGTFKENTHVNYELLDASVLYEDTNFKCMVSIDEGIAESLRWIMKIDSEVSK